MADDDIESRNWDILIAGGGNAALCAAIAAAEGGARVLVCEAAPWAMRGGNSRHTRNMRCAHDGPVGTLTESYGEDEYFDDLLRVTAGKTDEALARQAIHESAELVPWLTARGVRFQKSLGGTLSLSRTNPFFLGGGKAELNALYRHAEALGVRILYNAEVLSIDVAEGFFRSAEVRVRGFVETIAARAFVAAAGGFQANIEWLAEAWGPAARNFLIRGTPYARGTLLRQLFDCGAMPVAEADQCHCVAIDARAPQFDGGLATRLDSVPFSVVVNRNGERFYDEGEDFWPKRYAIWGRLVAMQPDQIGYSIVDAKSYDLFMPSIYPPFMADSIAALAAKLGLDGAAVAATVARFNAACRPGHFDHAVHDDCRTEGLDIEKTHWARPIDTPPFYGYPLRPGITFTYLGVTVDGGARIRMADGRLAANMFAAGEIMAGNILGQGYLAGIGMTIGAVFGRKAGREAARHVRN
jgi:tricarballylate dehydrogenase